MPSEIFPSYIISSHLLIAVHLLIALVFDSGAVIDIAHLTAVFMVPLVVVQVDQVVQCIVCICLFL